MERTVHRLELILFVLHVHLVEHRLPVEVKVARRLPQVHLGDVRCVQQLISLLEMNLLPEVLERVPDHGALWMPEDEPSAHLVGDGKQVELPAQGAMVPFGSLLSNLVERIQLCGVRERAAVNSLKLGLVLIAPPVRAGHVVQADGVGIDVSRVLDVRSGAQVPPRALLSRLADVVYGDGRVRVPLDDRVEDLKLVRLPDRLDPLPGLLGRQLLAHKRQLLLDYLLHLLPDAGKGLFCQRLLHRKVVVKPVVDPGSDRALRALEQLLNRHCHDVRTTVTQAQHLVALPARGEVLQRQRCRGLSLL
mmetsp:Transcript_4626/g.13148  ORF Transcript_4626/g.13148 Transcript_4626/m.13148 type:complete len:305 (-) Transcript_4626:287-1201(-)